MNELERLAELRDKGLITDEEFEAERGKIVPTPGPPPDPPSDALKSVPNSFLRPHPIISRFFSNRSLGLLSGLLTLTLMLLVLTHVWRIVAHAQRWSLVNDILNGPSLRGSSQVRALRRDAVNADNLVTGSYSAMILISIVWLLLMIIWAWRATNNLEHWNKNPKWGKGWAIAGWFIPIGNLFIPYQVVRDAWKLAPSKDSNSQATRNNWWLVSFISYWIGTATFFMAFSSTDVYEITDATRNAEVGAIVGISIQIISAITMIKAIRQISDRHKKAALT